MKMILRFLSMTLMLSTVFISCGGGGGGSGDGSGGGSSGVSVPNAPSNLTATAVSSTQVDLTWTDNSTDEDGFKIERSPDNINFIQITTVAQNVTSYSDTGLQSTSFYYRVKAYNTAGDSSYSNVAASNMWAQKADLPANAFARYFAVGFSIEDKGYIGTGYDEDDNGNKYYYDDFWEYTPDPQGGPGTWTQKANFGGGVRAYAVGFSIGNKGYIGTGVYEDPIQGRIFYKDFYEYDPAGNTWTQKADFLGNPRAGAVGFSIGTKGYIGTGAYEGQTGIIYCNDFYEYDPAQGNYGTWTQKADFGGPPRLFAVGFSISNKGYIGTGGNNFDPQNYNLNPMNDFWEYDPANGPQGTWTQKASLQTARGGAVGFSIGGKGYIGTGWGGGTNFYKDFYEYDPAGNTWTQKADFSGGVRAGGVGFSIGDKGYIGTGHGEAVGTKNDYKDLWEYDP